MSGEHNKHSSLHTDDAGAWRALRMGDVDALGYFYERYFARLFAYGKKICRSNELAADCVQDLFYKVWTIREKLPDVSSPQGYLFLSYRNTVLDKLKEINRAHPRPELVDNQSLLSTEDLMIEQETTKHNLEKVSRGLKLLSKKQQEIIYLRFYVGLSYDEIASVLDIKNQTIRNAVSSALKYLRNLVCSTFLFF